MNDASAKNTPIPSFLRIVTIVECFVVAAAGIALFFFPAFAKTAWVWDVPPFNSRYVGAIYFAALLPLIVLAWVARWSPGRVVLWMIFVFTTCIGLVMLMYISKFEWTRFGTPVFWALFQVSNEVCSVCLSGGVPFATPVFDGASEDGACRCIVGLQNRLRPAEIG